MQRSSQHDHANSSQANRDSRRGFVLMLVLALIVFAVTLLARFSQQSIGLASQAHRREREIQNRWAAWSLASNGVHSADKILQQSDEENRQVRANFRNLQIELGGQLWHLRINNLDTSINLNTVNRLTNGNGATRIMASYNLPEVPFRATQKGQFQPIDSWGQLLKTSAMTPSQIADLQQECSCWGSGRLNIRHVTDKVLSQLGRALGRTGLFNRVIRERARSEIPTLKSMIAAAAISPEDTKLLNATLSDRSGSFSVIVWNPQSGDPAMQCILESGFGNYADRHSTFRYEQQ